MSAAAASVSVCARETRVVRVLVVDDSVVMRRMLTHMLTSIESVEVVGAARDGVEGLRKVNESRPDLVLLDVEMPGPNGIEILRAIRREHPQVRVIMCSSLTVSGSATTIDALLAGADDFVAKQNSGHVLANAQETLRAELEERIQRIFRKRAEPRPALTAYLRETPRPRQAAAPEILAIGVSTGGPALLSRLLPELPADLSVPVVVVQHMPPFFTQLLAERLDKVCGLRVLEAVDGMSVEAGMVLLAPGDFHMRVHRSATGCVVRLDKSERENSCRPAVDVLFRSVAEHYGARSLGVVLTGMGEDGLRGARLLRSAGADVLAQDEETSVVWGMPGAVVNAGLASAVLPAGEIIPEVMRRV